MFKTMKARIQHKTLLPQYSLLLVLLLSATTRSINAQEVENEREFSYDVNSEIGPLHWGKIHWEWKECNSGNLQSPIDMLNQRVEIVSHLGRLKKSYQPSNATLINRGHDMMVKWNDDVGHLQINGTTFVLKQTHWHSPSEHTVDGRRFDMEVHLVHQSEDKRIAVIGIMYKIGRADTFLSLIKPYLEKVAHLHNTEMNIGIVDPKLIKFGSRKYYRYVGSLTTPPCTQNVIWTIVKKVRTVTREQLALIRDAVHDESATNARPIQRLNERKLELYRPRGNARI